MPADDVAGPEPTRRQSALPADCPAAALETGPALRVGFQHPLDPCTKRLTNPPGYYIRRGSGKFVSNLCVLCDSEHPRLSFDRIFDRVEGVVSKESSRDKSKTARCSIVRFEFEPIFLDPPITLIAVRIDERQTRAGEPVRVANRSARLQDGNIVRPQSRALSRHRCTVEVRSEDIGEERSGFLYRVLSITSISVYNRSNLNRVFSPEITIAFTITICPTSCDSNLINQFLN